VDFDWYILAWLQPIVLVSLEAMTNVWSPNIVPNIVDRDKIIL